MPPAGYFCHKRCQINGFGEYARVFSLLKSRDKTRSADRWWKTVCEQCGWPFVPSL